MIKSFNLDLMRIMATFLVIVLHTSSVYFSQFHNYWSISLFYDNFSRVSVPIFFLISGYLLLGKEESISSFMIKRSSKIIIPFLAWTLFYIAYDYDGWSKSSNLYSLINKPAFYHLWFLYAIMFMYALTPALRVVIKYSDKSILKYIILIWFSYASIYQLTFDIKSQVIDGVLNKLSSSLENYVSLLGIYILGGYIRKFKPSYPFLNLAVVFISCMALNLIMTRLLSTYTGSPNQILFKYYSPLVVISSCAIFMFFLKFDFNVNPKTESITREVSKLSFGVYLIHVALLPLAFKFINPAIDSIYSALTIPTISMVVFILSLFISLIMSRTPVIRKCV